MKKLGTAGWKTAGTGWFTCIMYEDYEELLNYLTMKMNNAFLGIGVYLGSFGGAIVFLHTLFKLMMLLFLLERYCNHHDMLIVDNNQLLDMDIQ